MRRQRHIRRAPAVIRPDQHGQGSERHDAHEDVASPMGVPAVILVRCLDPPDVETEVRPALMTCNPDARELGRKPVIHQVAAHLRRRGYNRIRHPLPDPCGPRSPGGQGASVSSLSDVRVADGPGRRRKTSRGQGAHTPWSIRACCVSGRASRACRTDRMSSGSRFGSPSWTGGRTCWSSACTRPGRPPCPPKGTGRAWSIP